MTRSKVIVSKNSAMLSGIKPISHLLLKDVSMTSSACHLAIPNKFLNAVTYALAIFASVLCLSLSKT